MENISNKLRSAMDAAFGQIKGGGTEAHKLQNDFKADIPEIETHEATGSGGAGGYVTKLFSEVGEGEKLKKGKADNLTLMDLVKKYSGKTKDIEKLKKISNLLIKQLKKGVKIEMEHTSDTKTATEIALDHISEDPKYYDKLQKYDIEESWSEKYKKSIDCNNPKGFSQKAHCQGKKKKSEAKEATSSASSGSYVTPAAWAKSTSKKHWRGAAKTQIPGGKFVKVKEKCKKFPYCNQGDTNTITLFENELVKGVIKNISKKHNISESVIKHIILSHYNKKLGNNSK